MTTSKGVTPPSQPILECCMCGDYGLSYELFDCKVCQFRSQHRYCSNLYPKADSYRVCNWCLSQKDDTVEKTQNSSNSSSSNKNNSEDDRVKNKKKNGGSDNHGGPKGQRGTLQLQLNSPIKKQKSPERSPSSTTRKRIISGGGGTEERVTRTRSEEISNSGIITKQVFRNKVRRYKLLDEVSSQ
uniref:PHD-type zinc finger plants domain-containing protein n=1 Tax=Davidia involucrata TaxID=16924 RepID=A0A5B7BV87_DAVIN